MLRKLSLILICTFPCSVFADNVIFTPLANVLQKEQIKITDFYASGHKANEYSDIECGLGGGFELGITENRFNDLAYQTSLNLEYNYLPPFTDYAPGIAFGVIDAMNRTEVGRQFYFVTSFSVGLSYDLQQSLALTVSLGELVGRRSTPFVNVVLPLGGSVDYLVEDDGDRINTGFDLAIMKEMKVRAVMRSRVMMLGLTWSHRF